MNEIGMKKPKPGSRVSPFGCIVWVVALILTILYWGKVSEAGCYWIAFTIMGHVVLLQFVFRRGVDSVVRMLISQGKYNEALKTTESTLTCLPNHAPLWYAKGECLGKLGRTKEAKQAYRKALELDSSHAYAANNLATLLMNEGDYLGAAEYYRLAKKAGASGDWFDRNLQRIRNNLAKRGTELAQAGGLLEAAEYYCLAKEFDAGETTFDHNLRHSVSQAGSKREAEFKVDPDRLSFLNNLHVLKGKLITKGKAVQDANPELAIKYADAILSVDSDYAIAYAWRGALLQERGRYEKAIRDIRRCRKLDPAYRPKQMEELIEDTERLLAEFRKLPGARDISTVRDASSTDDSRLWKPGEYAFGRLLVTSITKGGMGCIYFAWNVKYPMPLVLKAIDLSKRVERLRTTTANRIYKDLFKTEAKNWLELGEHPNILRLHTVALFEHRHLVLQMEYVAGVPNIGPTLWHHLKTKCLGHSRGLSMETAVQIAVSVCDAMDYAYDKSKLIHRDLKPENIFITDDGTTKVGDFGLAVRDDPGARPKQEGTGPYVAPEIDRHPPTRTMDIYAIGVILFEMLAGHLPIPRESEKDDSWRKWELKSWIQAHQQIKPLPLTDANPQVPARLADIVMRCLSKDPRERFQSFADLRNALVGDSWSPSQGPAPATDQATYHYNQGVSADSLGDYPGALQHYREAVKFEPYLSQTSVAWCNMGKVLSTMAKYPESPENEEALECYRKAIQIDPNDTHALFGRANVLASMTRYGEARDAVEKLLATDPERHDAYGCKGSILLHLGRLDEAEAAYQKALQMHPTHEDFAALNGLGLCARARAGHGLRPASFALNGLSLRAKQKLLFEEAREYFEKAIGLKDDYAEAHANRCDALRHLGQPEEAIKSGEKAVKLDPSQPGCRINLAMAYGNAGHFEEAAEHFEKAVELRPNEGFAWLGLAFSYAELKRSDDAILCARRATRLGYPEELKELAEGLES